ncbi:hypothetical protein PENSPDRAFT_279426 [Peniophora sp. CONT]|nr:hypothetical protein PENSPDRAFT_279426 [Peniophora sp. CONT]
MYMRPSRLPPGRSHNTGACLSQTNFPSPFPSAMRSRFLRVTCVHQRAHARKHLQAFDQSFKRIGGRTEDHFNNHGSDRHARRRLNCVGTRMSAVIAFRWEKPVASCGFTLSRTLPSFLRACCLDFAVLVTMRVNDRRHHKICAMNSRSEVASRPDCTVLNNTTQFTRPANLCGTE